MVIMEECSILWEVIAAIGHCEGDKNSMNMRLILHCCRGGALCISRPKSVRVLSAGLDEQRNLQKKCGYTRRTARSRFGCCCPHNES
jgi:hypothetical protein